MTASVYKRSTCQVKSTRNYVNIGLSHCNDKYVDLKRAMFNCLTAIFKHSSATLSAIRLCSTHWSQRHTYIHNDVVSSSQILTIKHKTKEGLKQFLVEFLFFIFINNTSLMEQKFEKLHFKLKPLLTEHL